MTALVPAYWNRGSIKERSFLIKSKGIIWSRIEALPKVQYSSFNFLYLIDLNARKTVSPRKWMRVSPWVCLPGIWWKHRSRAWKEKGIWEWYHRHFFFYIFCYIFFISHYTHICNYYASEIMVVIMHAWERRLFVKLKWLSNFVYIAFPRKPGRPRDYAHLDRTQKGFNSDLWSQWHDRKEMHARGGVWEVGHRRR